MESIPSNLMFPLAPLLSIGSPSSSGNTDVGYSMLFAQDHAQEAIVNRQPAVAARNR